MTKARMDWKQLVLQLDGHAGSGVKGKDIVCAAESMLTQALLQVLIEMDEQKQAGLMFTGSAEAGFLRIEAAPAEGYEAETRAAFRVAVTGLRMLAEKYPEYVRLKEE